MSRHKNNLWDLSRHLRLISGVDIATVRARLGNTCWAWAVLWILILTVVGGYLTLMAGGREKYASNQLLLDSVYARVDFQALDKERTRLNREDAFNAEPAVYQMNEAFFRETREQIDSLVKIAGNSSITTVNQLPTENRLINDDRVLAGLRTYIIKGQPTPQWTELVEGFMRDLASDMAILAQDRATFETNPDQRATRIALVSPAGETTLPDDFIVSVKQPDQVRNLVTALADKWFDKSFRRCFVDIVMRRAEQPSYLFDSGLTDQRKKARAEALPAVNSSFKTGQELVPAGTILDLGDLEKIRLENLAWERQLKNEYPGSLEMQNAGRVGVLGLLAVLLWLYVMAVNPRVAQNPMRGMALTLLLVSTLAVATFAALAYPPRLLYIAAIFPTLLLVMILTVAYSQRFAFAVAALNALMVTFALNLGMDYAVIVLTGIGISAGLLKTVGTRSKLITTGVAAGFGMAVALIITTLATRPVLLPQQWSNLWIDAARVLATGIASGLLMQGMLPTIEMMFRVTTELTFKELNDASLPLLRRLAQEAPGTYQHSLRIADMAEAGANAIGADGLLCKVGAMYHDIGKLSKPEYFVENQGEGPNQHDKLSPAMSVLIIVAHVRDGMEMAREYGLPQPVRQFIETHHGTTVVEYFYHAAKRQSAQQDRPAPEECAFRYPGPKPQNRETAILLICDGVEGAARTLPNPTQKRFEDLVSSMIQKRLADGQFDECGITLQELNKVQAAIVFTLCAMYHRRIAYPTNKPGDPIEQARISVG